VSAAAQEIRTHDRPVGEPILTDFPPGVQVELRPGSNGKMMLVVQAEMPDDGPFALRPAADGGTVVVRVRRITDAAAQPTRQQQEAENRRALERVVAAGGARVFGGSSDAR